MTVPVDSRTKALWLFDEQADSLLPVDLTGGLSLTTPPGLASPTVATPTITGFGRTFARGASASAFKATDSAGRVRLKRAVTIVALARLNFTGLADGSVCTLVQRGRGGASDPYCYALTVEVLDLATRLVRLALSWQTAAGLTVVDTGVTFKWPAAGAGLDDYLLIGAAREVVEGLLAVRYQVNGDSKLGDQNHPLDCGGNASADVAVGAGMSAALYQNHWSGVIDCLEIANDAVTPEEFRWVWERIAIDQPDGVETIRRFVPSGDVYSTDPSSRIQRELAMEGRALGQAKSLARKLRFYYLPDQAFGKQLERWESITGLVPRPTDDWAKRRARVLAFLQQKLGFGVADLKKQFAPLFDLADADVEILEFSNTMSLPFTTVEDYPGGCLLIDGNVNFSVIGGKWNGAGTAAEIRYNGLLNPRAGITLWSLSSGKDAWVQANVSVVSASNGDPMAGLVMGRRVKDEWLFVGLTRTGVNTGEIRRITWKGNALVDAVTIASVAFNATNMYLRAKENGTFDLYYGAGALNTLTPVNIAPVLQGYPDYAGLAVLKSVDTAGNVSLTADFDDLVIKTPNGKQRFCWYAYRNPALAGTPDMKAARDLAARIKPAHTVGSACTTKRLTCGDPSNGCGTAPLGI